MKVLLAEDDPTARALVKRWLEHWGYEVIVAADGLEALRYLDADRSIRMAIVDWMMPHLDGIDLCRELRAQPREPYVYLILLTGKTDKADVIRGLEAGADDYISKPCHALELEVRLRAGRRVVDLQQELIVSREALRREAMHDPLTGLLNRGALLEHLDQELERVNRGRGSVCAIMIDVDHFKAINDAHGHLVGDRVLNKLARRFEEGLRPYDALGRLGGEEFLMVLPDCDTHYGQGVAERLRRATASVPVRAQDGELRVTASFGVAATEQCSVLSAEVLLRAVDTALYRAKASGRDRVCLAQPGDWVMPIASERWGLREVGDPAPPSVV